MDMRLMRHGAFLLFMSLTAGCAHGTEEDFIVRYACVEANFRERVPVPQVLDTREELTTAAIQSIARGIPVDLQAALKEAANLSINPAVVDSDGRIVPDAFYEHFVNNVGQELKRRIDIEGCGQDLEDALYNVGINRYFAHMVGKGEMYRWFVQHGGPYSYPAWMAAVVALELIGRSPDMDVWKSFYGRYSVRFKNPR